MKNLKYINNKSKIILEKIINKLVPIEPLNIKVIKPKWAAYFLQIKIEEFADRGHVIYLSKIIKNKEGGYKQVPKISFLKPYKNNNYYPIKLENTENNKTIIGMKITKSSFREYKEINPIDQKALTEYSEQFLNNINNMRIN